jgi:hypothetical protein
MICVSSSVRERPIILPSVANGNQGWSWMKMYDYASKVQGSSDSV